MRLDLKDAEKLLGIPAITIERWVRQGRVPAREEAGCLVFHRKELEKWARTRQLPLCTEAGEERCAEPFDEESLSEAMCRGGVFFNVPGETVEEVLREVVGLAPLPAVLDPDLLLRRLLEREQMASTGIGDGIAIPHPRYPLEGIGERPMITTAFLRNPLDYGSVDRVPVFVVFLMLSPTTNNHLRLLSRLSFCLRNGGLMALLRTCRDEECLLEGVRKAESAS